MEKEQIKAADGSRAKSLNQAGQDGVSKNPRPLAAIVLAAGEAKRMGRSKLLLPFGALTVLGRTLDNLKKGGIGSIYLVVGHQREELLASIDTRGLHIVENEDYQKGQSTSVKQGIAALPPGYGAMFVLGDQPLIPPEVYRHLAEAYQNGRAPIVLPVNEEGKRGNPAVFAPELFEEISLLAGDTGPRSLLEKYKDLSQAVYSQEQGIFLDLDTQAAYEKCLKEAGLR